MRTCDFPFGFGIPSPSLTLPRHKPVLHFAGLEAEHVHGWSDAFVRCHWHRRGIPSFLPERRRCAYFGRDGNVIDIQYYYVEQAPTAQRTPAETVYLSTQTAILELLHVDEGSRILLSVFRTYFC